MLNLLLRIVIEEKVGPPLPWILGFIMVTQTSPSPGISYIHTVPQAAEISRITSADSVKGHSTSSSKESMASNVLKDVHIVRIENGANIFVFQFLSCM